jgi:anti-anti-sigma factor
MKINQTDTYTQVTFSGRLDAATARELQKDALQAVENENTHIIIDCTGLEYISSSGLKVLLMLQALSQTHKTKHLQSLNPASRDIQYLSFRGSSRFI